MQTPWIPTPIPPLRATVTTQPGLASPTPIPGGARLALDAELRPGELFDLDALPEVDTSDWVTHVGPLGLIQFRTPKDWVVQIYPAAPGVTTAETFRAVKPGDHWDVHLGTSVAGWVEIGGGAGPFEVTYTRGPWPSVREALIREPVAQAGRLGEIVFIQTGRDVQFPRFEGALQLIGQGSTAGGFFHASAYLHQPTTAGDLATALAILRSVEDLR